MPELKFKPVRHDHGALLAKAADRAGFVEAYDTLALAYPVASQMLMAPNRSTSTSAGMRTTYRRSLLP